MANTIEFPVNEKYPTDKFVTPFSRIQNARITWTNLNIRQFELIEHEKVMLQELSKMRIASSIQLSKYYPDPDNALGKKGRLKKMCSSGFLLPHKLKTEKKEITVYTLGPLGYAAVGIKILDTQDLNWWETNFISSYGVFRHLIINQLYFKFKTVEKNTYLLRALHPYVSIIMFREMDISIHLAAPNANNISEDLRWEKNKRILVLSETLEEARIAAKKLNESNEIENIYNFRFITDENIFNVDLHLALMIFDTNENDLVQDVIEDLMVKK